MNAGWHKRHTLPKNATIEERLDWHLDHQDHCACRAIPAGLTRLLTSSPLRDFLTGGDR